jgi:hypothetical protein
MKISYARLYPEKRETSIIGGILEKPTQINKCPLVIFNNNV